MKFLTHEYKAVLEYKAMNGVQEYGAMITKTFTRT